MTVKTGLASSQADDINPAHDARHSKFLFGAVNRWDDLLTFSWNFFGRCSEACSKCIWIGFKNFIAKAFSSSMNIRLAGYSHSFSDLNFHVCGHFRVRSSGSDANPTCMNFNLQKCSTSCQVERCLIIAVFVSRLSEHFNQLPSSDPSDFSSLEWGLKSQAIPRRPPEWNSSQLVIWITQVSFTGRGWRFP